MMSKPEFQGFGFIQNSSRLNSPRRAAPSNQTVNSSVDANVVTATPSRVSEDSHHHLRESVFSNAKRGLENFKNYTTSKSEFSYGHQSDDRDSLVGRPTIEVEGPAVVKTSAPRFPTAGHAYQFGARQNGSASIPIGMDTPSPSRALDSDNSQHASSWSKDNAMSFAPEGLENLFRWKQHLLLNTSQYTSVTSALNALNSGLVKAEDGYCLVFSKTKRWYFLLRRNDKIHESLCDLAIDLLSDLAAPFANRPLAKDANGSWSCMQSLAIGKTLCELEHLLSADVDIVFLGMSRWNSVVATVNALNAGLLQAHGGYCVVFSKTSKLYYFIWRSDKDSERARILAPLALNGTQTSSLMEASSSSIVASPKRVLSVSSLETSPSIGSTPSPLRAALAPQGYEASPTRVSKQVVANASPIRGTASKKATMSEAGVRRKFGGSQSLQVSELFFFDKFDLTMPMLQTQLFTALGLSPQTLVENLPQPGGLNCGVWRLSDACTARDLVLKLVKTDRREGERLLKLSRELPGLMQDTMLAFPVHIFHCMKEGGVKEFDLLAMPRVSGTSLGDVIGSLWWGNRSTKAMELIEKAGSCLAEFHRTYDGYQHGDFQPSNIYYNESEDALCFIDLADIGPGPFQVNDVPHFLNSICLISNAYGPQFFTDAKRHFEAGYATLSRPRTSTQCSHDSRESVLGSLYALGENIPPLIPLRKVELANEEPLQ